MKESKANDRLNLFKLKDASEFTRWKNLLQDHMFKKIHNINMDRLTTADTLDLSYFKREFKKEYREATLSVREEERAAGQDGEGEHPLKNPEFLKMCTDHAFTTGEGFEDWLYVIYSDVRTALSDEIQDKTAGVVRGDLISLLRKIKLALHHSEINNPDALDIKYTKCTMEGEGKQDLMTFTAALTNYMRRLDAAGFTVRDPKAQRVLLNGLDQDIFENFISDAKRNPYTNYASLQKAVEETAEEPRMLRKLAALKPGIAQSLLVTQGRSHAQAQQPSATKDDRIDKIEAILVSLAQSMQAKSTTAVCHAWARSGSCKHADRCRYSHAGPPGTATADPPPGKWCEFHKSAWHDTADCRQGKPRQSGGQHHVNATTTGNNQATSTTMNGYTFCFTTRITMPQHVFTMREAPKIDMWCVDGASTTFATYDRARCFNIQPCQVSIFGPNVKDNFVCTEMGNCYVDTYDKTTGKASQMLATNVLINENFPFHIFSEILAFEKRCTATKELGSWQFYSPDKQPLFHASQRLLTKIPAPGHSDVKLYFIDDQAHQAPVSAPVVSADTEQILAVKTTATKINTAKNLQMLLELHCAHDHWNFEAVAAQYGLTLPDPRPLCWACLIAKPRRITHDKVSTRQCTRVSEGFAADAKGPINTPTPEGYKYYFLIVCLYSYHYWAVLAKSQADWETIWPIFVKREEARSGKERCVSFLITDGHKVHSQESMKIFNDGRGIQTISTAPHSQWQDPAERGIQTITNGARTSLIHGGGKPWMWGWAVLHSTDSTNRMKPPVAVLGHEGKSRLRIAYPSVTQAKEMRTHKPFLSLAFKTKPKPELGSNFNPRAEPCVFLIYVPAKKAYAMLTIPNLYLTYSIEIRSVTGTFPLRVTDYLTNQLDTFLRPSVEDDLYSSIHGPSNVLRRQPMTGQALDPSTLIQQTPVVARQPVVPAELPGPGHSSTRGYMPTEAGLQSAASRERADVPAAAHAVATQARACPPKKFTPDELAARTPRSIFQALGGPDSKFWLPGIIKDFDVLRTQCCIINITSTKPPGPAPPPVEQRFKIKYREEQPIALEDIDPAAWKARTVTRGDRFKFGQHYDATAAPVIHTPVLKVLIAWAVAKGLKLYQWDQGAAFYGNPMDREGVIVQLPPGYDPDSRAIRPLHLPPLYGELAKALPGIPQGSLLHYRAIFPALQELNFMPVDADNCLFLHATRDMATTLHVDDGVLAVPSHEDAVRVLGSTGLGAKRTITWGPLHSTLGVDFEVVYTAEKRLVFMSQRAYAVTILKRAGMMDCNPARTPATPGRAYTKGDCPVTDAEKDELTAGGMLQKTYHTIQASLNFLVTISRDDMKFIQGKAAKYCLNPGKEHFKIQKHALRFLKGTLDYGIEFVWRASDTPPVDGPLVLEAWSDSSYADDIDTGRTTLGNVLKANGATVSATSKLSSRVDSCVNHSELHAFNEAAGVAREQPTAATIGLDEPTDGSSIAFTKTARSITWLRGIKAALERRNVDDMPATPIYVDNAGVLAMIDGTTIKSANKHIYRTLAEARERVHLDKSVKVVKIGTKDNIANAMTKQEPGIDESAAQLRRITGPISIKPPI
jgi:hypothetical protein